MEGLRFELDFVVYHLEEGEARDASDKLRHFAHGDHQGDVVTLEQRGVPRTWLDGVEELAERIDRAYATEDMTPIILHNRGAEAMYAVLSVTGSVNAQPVSDRYRLWTALGGYLGFGPGLSAFKAREAAARAAQEQIAEEHGVTDPSDLH